MASEKKSAIIKCIFIVLTLCYLLVTQFTFFYVFIGAYNKESKMNLIDIDKYGEANTELAILFVGAILSLVAVPILIKQEVINAFITQGDKK